MPAIQPFCFRGADEKLGSVGVGSSIGHRQDTRSSVLQLEVLIRELPAVNGLPSGSVVVREIATLTHKLRDDAVECGSLVTEAVLTGAQRSEVLGSSWNNFGVELEGYPAERLVIGSNVEENRRVVVGGRRPAAVHTRRGKGEGTQFDPV